ncbi:MAG: hypothetical protein NTY64_19310, partial [Deltaproteobacteria bacterium]|nr:hypothetical protein [Deltaproteobacteria bacterium]
TALQSSGSPLDLKTSGRIYVSQLKAGASAAAPNPVIDSQVNAGGLVVSSGISAAALNFGLSQELYNHLKFNANNKTADISGITVVEVFYKYTPITPLPNFIQNILVSDGGGIIVLGKSVF